MYNACISVCVLCTHEPFSDTGTVAVAVDEKRNNLMEFGRYVQEMLPKFVQHAQITHRYIVHICIKSTLHLSYCNTCTCTYT